MYVGNGDGVIFPKKQQVFLFFSFFLSKRKHDIKVYPHPCGNGSRIPKAATVKPWKDDFKVHRLVKGRRLKTNRERAFKQC